LRIPPNRNGASGVIGPSWVLTDDISQVALIGNSYYLDETTQTLSIAWDVMGCGSYRLTTFPPATGEVEAAGCDTLDRAADIYFYA